MIARDSDVSKKFYRTVIINFRQLAINGQKYCVLAHAFSPQRAEARLGEEMFINGYALKTR